MDLDINYLSILFWVSVRKDLKSYIINLLNSDFDLINNIEVRVNHAQDALFLTRSMTWRSPGYPLSSGPKSNYSPSLIAYTKAEYFIIPNFPWGGEVANVKKIMFSTTGFKILAATKN
jgi:hypothetical protein